MLEKEIANVYRKFISDLGPILDLMREILKKRSVAHSIEDDFKLLKKGCEAAKDNFIFDYKNVIQKYKKDASIIDILSVQSEIKALDSELKNKLDDLITLAKAIEEKYNQLNVFSQIEFSDFILAGNLKYDKIMADCKKAIKENKKDPRVEARLRIRQEIEQAEKNNR